MGVYKNIGNIESPKSFEQLDADRIYKVYVNGRSQYITVTDKTRGCEGCIFMKQYASAKYRKIEGTDGHAMFTLTCTNMICSDKLRRDQRAVIFREI